MRWSLIDNQPFFSHAYFCSARRIYPCRVRPLIKYTISSLIWSIRNIKYNKTMSVLIWRLCQNAQKIDDRFYSTNNGCAIHIPGRRVWIGEDSEATCGEELNLGRCFGRSKGRKRLSEANFCLKKFQGQLRKQQKWRLLRDIIIVFHCMIRMRKFIILLPG